MLFFAVILAIFSVTIGVLVLLRDYKSKINVRFFLVSLLAALWGLAFEATSIIYGSDATASRLNLLQRLNQASVILGVTLMFSIVVFSYSFPVERKKTILKMAIPFYLLIVALSLTKAIGETYSINSSSSFVYTDGNLTWLYILFMLLGVGLIVINLVRKRTGLTDAQRSQQKLLGFAFGASLTLGLFLAVILPLLVPSTSLDLMAPSALVLFLLPVGSAVARYKLFDFRAVLARAFAYTLVFSVLLIIYVAVGYGASVLLIDLPHGINLKTAITFFAISLIFAFLFAPLKRKFDASTSRLFFRDAYESQELIDAFNKTIVSTIDLNQLLLRSGSVIMQYIKPQMVVFAIRNNEDNSIRIITDKASEKKVTKETVDQIRSLIHKKPQKLFDTDRLETSDSNLGLLLKQEDIGMLVRVTTNIANEGIGYIVMGYKKSGNVYTKQDRAAMEIIANELAIAAQNALQFEQIQNFNLTLQEKVDDATRKLRRTNEKLKQLDETKDDFISMASHQLRTPLTSVKGYVSMVLDGDAGKINTQQKNLLEQAFTSSQRMVYLIADLLNVSRLKTGKFIIQPVLSNLADVVEGEISQLKETAKGRNLELTYDKPKKFPMLMIDETKVRQVIMNFADNAIYYTPAGGHIRIELEDKPTTIEYRVVDDGIGVPKTEQHHLFSKFYRAGNAKKARPDGTGLGLFMAQKVIIAQGGAVIFNSQEGQGSTFGFSFPKAKLQPTKIHPTPTEVETPKE